MSLFRRQIDPDPLDQWKDAKVDAQIAESEERDELRQKLCKALGWIYREVSEIRQDYDRAAVHPFDATLIQAAKAKLLTTDELRGRYADALCSYTPAVAVISDWALTQSTEVQQARAILEAIK